MLLVAEAVCVKGKEGIWDLSLYSLLNFAVYLKLLSKVKSTLKRISKIDRISKKQWCLSWQGRSCQKLTLLIS